MKNRLIALLLLFLFSLPFNTASAEAQAALSISPFATTLQVGQSATLSVRITDAKDLYAYDITLRYDPALVEITSIENSSFLQGGFTAAQILDKTAGTAQLAFTSIPPFTAQSGSGDLATFKVKAKTGGSARISIENIQLLQKDATAIVASSTTGTVTVTGGAATEAPRPASNPGGAAEEGQPVQLLNPVAGAPAQEPGVSITQPADTPGEEIQPTAEQFPRSTVVPSAPLPAEEPQEDGGLPPVVWMIPLGIALLAIGYFGGNFLRARTRK